MTEQEFRIKYSKLMDDSQALEDELRRYYALCNGKDLSDYWDIWNKKIGDNTFGQLLNLFKEKKYNSVLHLFTSRLANRNQIGFGNIGWNCAYLKHPRWECPRRSLWYHPQTLLLWMRHKC